MVPIPKPEEIEQQEMKYDLLPAGEVVMIVERVECAKAHAPSMNYMYKMRMKPLLFEGNYGLVFLNLLEEGQMAWLLHSFCEAAGLSKGHIWPPCLRLDENIQNSFLDIPRPAPGAPQDDNLICENMRGRVVIAVLKQAVNKLNGKLESVVDINAKPPFKPYIVNGEPYHQPALITGKPVVQAQVQQRTIAPPPDDELEEDVILPDDTPTI